MFCVVTKPSCYSAPAMEIGPIRERLVDLNKRLSALRGYL